MASINDAGNVSSTVANQRQKLQTAPIDERDRAAIEKFVRHRRVHGTETSSSYTGTTEINDLCMLRGSAERAPTPLVDMGIDAVNAYLELLQTDDPPKDANGKTWRSKDYEGPMPGEDGYGYGVGKGIDSYTRALRVFYRWLDRHDEYGEYPFWREIKTGNVEYTKPAKREFPSQDDYEAMMDAARGSPRNQAILAFFWEAAVRRTLGAQLRVGDLDLDGDRATFKPNPDGENQKDVEIKPYTLYNGVATLRSWVNNHHPDPDNPGAPLFPVTNYDPDDYENCALSPFRIYEIIKDLGEKAGIDENVEVKPHAFRHAAIGRWKERGYGLPHVQRRVAWSDESAAEMWARYGDPDDEVIDQHIDRLEGREPAGDDADVRAPPIEARTCGNCKTTDITSDHCPECGAPVSPEARKKAEAKAAQHGPMIRVSTDSAAGEFARALGFEGGQDGQILIQLPSEAEVPESLLAPDAD